MLKINSLYASYGKITVLSDITLNIEKGSFTALIGKNGSGKSTLVTCLGSALKFSGEITIDSLSFSKMSSRERAQHIAVMPQLLSAPAISVRELVSFGRSPYLATGEKMSDTDKAAVDSAIKKADLTSLESRRLDTLSGGELRRAYFGMLLAQDTEILILDEATAYMDTENENKLLEMVSSAGKTVLCVMHDLTSAVKFADRIALIDGGRLAFCKDKDTVLQQELIEKHFNVKRYTAQSGEETKIFFA